MTTSACSKSSACRSHWAIALCFSSATITGLQALHPGGCVWGDMTADQSYLLDVAIATLSMFLATFLLARLVSSHSHDEKA